MSTDTRAFWQTKTLAAMSDSEWESLCDGCGRCCLVKLEGDDSEEIYFTAVACRLLDTETARCRDYANRLREVADCVALTPEVVTTINWLPPTCAYRLIAERRPLYAWHPLRSGSADTVHTAGISVRGKVVSEELVPDEDLEDHIIYWVD